MLGMMDEFLPAFSQKAVTTNCPTVVQTLSEEELVNLVPQFDGWIIGDDPATRRVFQAGKAGRLKAAVKWGVGVDNVDFTAAKELGIHVANTPLMFGREVADIAMAYIVALARETFLIHDSVRRGEWRKPRGISLQGKTLALVGCGDIGRNIVRRALATEMKILVYDPEFRNHSDDIEVAAAEWPERIETADFIVFACSLTPSNVHMLNESVLERVKHGVRIVNVSRGLLLDEIALAQGLSSGRVHSAALDVFEVEPLPLDSPLRQFERCIFGSHNASNTVDAVRRASSEAIKALFSFLGIA
jgi:D-3-phosphoglycerate dehydrogenase